MKIQFIFYSLILVLIFSCKNDNSKIKTGNPFKHIEKVEKQVINLDTLTKKEIIGKKGTKIYFNRDDFEIGENDSITLELKEYYSLEALISDNIQTITTSKQLLESNGVVYLDFTVNGEKIKLKEDKKLRMQFPTNLNENDRVYMGEIDFNNQMYWTIDNSALTNFLIYDSTYVEKYGVDRLYEILIPFDSIEFYRNENRRIQEQINIKNRRSYVAFFIDDFGWINIDKIINPDTEIDFELISNNKEIKFVNNFILYKGLNSFISYQRKINELSFKKIPVKNETTLVIIGKKDKVYYADKIKLSSKTNGKIGLNLKKIDSTELKSLIKK